jgi:probable HAF family extracellular repeat protein
MTTSKSSATASLVRISVLSLLPFVSAAAMAAPRYQLVDLGVLSGQSSSIATSINASGTIVGTSGNLPFISHGCGMTDLGVLSGGSSASANAIDNRGIIAGSAVGSDGATHAVSWQPNGSIQLLQPGATYQSQGLGIDATGKVVGYEYELGIQASVNATAYVNGVNVIVPSDDDPTYGWGSVQVVNAANGSGQLAGYRQIFNSQNQFITQLGVVLPAGSTSWVRITPPAVYNAYTYTAAMNEDGAVVGWSFGAIESSSAPHAFLSTNPGSAALNLGTLGGASSQAFGLNNARWVVGMADTATGSTAFLYDGFEMIDLNTTLTNGSGWTVTRAIAINDNDQIVGAGVHNGAQHAILLKPVTAAVSPISGIISSCGISIAPIAGTLE